MQKKIVAVYMLAIMGALLPFVAFLALVRSFVYGNFVLYLYNDQFSKTLDRFWTKQVEMILKWAIASDREISQA